MAQFRIDIGIASGVAGESLTADAARAGDLVSLTAISNPGTGTMVISSSTDDSPVPTLTEVTPNVLWTFTSNATPGHTYMFLYTDSVDTDERALAIKTAAGLRIPARNEGADFTTRIQNIDAAKILSSTDNEGGNPWGWAPTLEEVIRTLTIGLDGAYNAGGSHLGRTVAIDNGFPIQLTGTGTLLNVADDVVIGGKLTVTGMIDPPGLQMTKSAANPGANTETLWVSSAAGPGSDGDLFFGNTNISATLGGAAPASATYITLSAEGGLSNERVLTDGTGLTIASDSTTVTLAADFGTGAGKVTEGDDARLTDDRTADGLRIPSAGVVSLTGGAPSAGQVLKAINASTASWQADDTGSGVGSLDQSYNVGSTITVDNGAIVLNCTTGTALSVNDSVNAATGINIGSGFSTAGFENASESIFTGLVTLRASANLEMVDNLELRLGNGDDLKLFHDGTTSHIQNTLGALLIDNQATGSDIILRLGNTNGTTSFVVQNDTPTTIFEIEDDGTWIVNGDTGTNGQVLTSDATGAPTWEVVGVGSGSLDDAYNNGSTITADAGDVTIASSGGLSITSTGGISVTNGVTSLSHSNASNAPLFVDQVGLGDLISIQKSGTERFVIENDGGWDIGGSRSVLNDGDVLTANSSGPPSWEPGGGGETNTLANAGTGGISIVADPAKIGTALQARSIFSSGTITVAADNPNDRVTLTTVFGTTASTSCVGNDSRLSDARTPTGSAGGDLGGTYANPTVEAFQSATTQVNVGAATAPTTGQALTATNSTNATWQTHDLQSAYDLGEEITIGVSGPVVINCGSGESGLKFTASSSTTGVDIPSGFATGGVVSGSIIRTTGGLESSGAGGSNSIRIGASALVDHASSVVLGASAASTATNQGILGSASNPINEFIIGAGDTDSEASPTITVIRPSDGASTFPGRDLRVRAGDGAGNDASSGGGDLYLSAGGLSTDDQSSGGDVFIQTSSAIGSSTTRVAVLNDGRMTHQGVDGAEHFFDTFNHVATADSTNQTAHSIALTTNRTSVIATAHITAINSTAGAFGNYVVTGGVGRSALAVGSLIGTPTVSHSQQTSGTGWSVNMAISGSTLLIQVNRGTEGASVEFDGWVEYHIVTG